MLIIRLAVERDDASKRWRH